LKTFEETLLLFFLALTGGLTTQRGFELSLVLAVAIRLAIGV